MSERDRASARLQQARGVTGVGTLPIVLHASAAALGLAAVVMAWRRPVDPPEAE